LSAPTRSGAGAADRHDTEQDDVEQDDVEQDDVDAPAGGPRAARNAAVVVGIVLVLFIALLATRKSADERVGANQMLGKAMPHVSGTTMDGEQLDLDKFRGKWVVVNFFATWCVPCQQEHPELVKFSNAHAAKGDAVVVSIAFNDQPSALKAFFARAGGDWPVIVSDDGRAAIDFGVTGVPESFIVAPSQLVVDHFNGVTQAELDATIDRLGGSAVVAPGSSAPSGSPGSAPR
jgi:cytochrome c biogenesis protein CcmG/thiol:disulfide interchange protein DsbE